MHLIPPGIRAESRALTTLYNSGDAGLGSSCYRREPPEWALMSPVGSDPWRHERERCKPAVTTLLRYTDGGRLRLNPHNIRVGKTRNRERPLRLRLTYKLDLSELWQIWKFGNFKSTFQQTSTLSITVLNSLLTFSQLKNKQSSRTHAINMPFSLSQRCRTFWLNSYIYLPQCSNRYAVFEQSNVNLWPYLCQFNDH